MDFGIKTIPTLLPHNINNKLVLAKLILMEKVFPLFVFATNHRKSCDLSEKYMWLWMACCSGQCLQKLFTARKNKPPQDKAKCIQTESDASDQPGNFRDLTELSHSSNMLLRANCEDSGQTD